MPLVYVQNSVLTWLRKLQARRIAVETLFSRLFRIPAHAQIELDWEIWL